MKKTIVLIQLILFPFIWTSSYSQSNSKYFYFYKGEKINLELDLTTISISIEGDNNKNSFNSAASKILKKEISEFHSRKILKPTDQSAKDKQFSIKTFYTEIETDQITSESDYLKTIDEYRKKADVLIASPAFKKENQRFGLSNNFYVKVKDKNDLTYLYDNAKKFNLEVLGYDEFMPQWFTLSCGKNAKFNALETANLLYETGLFDAVEPELVYHDLFGSPPNDPFYIDQWGLKDRLNYDIKVEGAWQYTTGSPNIKIAVFDDGFEMNHPDLKGNVFGTGYDVITGTSPSIVYDKHGTACAGIIGAVQNNGIGVSGVAPTSKLVSISNNMHATATALARGFNWAVQNGIDIISNSWSDGSPSAIIDDAITNAFTYGRGGKGMIIVFCAMNSNMASIPYPANSNPLILVVGAVSPCGDRKSPETCDVDLSWGSNYGSELDVLAPGAEIPTTDNQGALGYTSTDYHQTFKGTSAACPHVAGVAALVLSINPNLTVTQVHDIITTTAQITRPDLYNYGTNYFPWNQETGSGIVNAANAVYKAKMYSTCWNDYSVISNVIPGNIDTKLAVNSITASNKIYGHSKAIYNAGKSICFEPGFEVEVGSEFYSDLKPCAGTFKSNGNSAFTNNEEVDNSLLESELIDINPTFNVYPNPSNGVFTVNFSNTELKNIQIYDSMGKLIYKKENVSDANLNIDLNGHSKGIYNLNVISNNSKLSKTIMVD